MQFLGSNAKPVTATAAQLEEANKRKRGDFTLYQAGISTISHKIINKRNAANDNGLAFEINSFQDVAEIMARSDGLCFYTRKPFTERDEPTFERIDPNLGYTRDNTAFARNSANNLKSALDRFEKGGEIPDEVKIKLLHKVVYRLTKKLKTKHA